MTQREMLQALRHSERRDGSRDSDGTTIDDENASGSGKDGTRKASSVPATPSSPQTDIGNIS